MKKHVQTFLLFFVIIICHNTIQAQSFLKRVVDNVKNTVQNRADTKTTNGTNKALDQVDSAVRIKPKSNKTGEGQSRLPGVFTKAAGGGEISSADSAKAIQAFKNTESGSSPGVYYEVTNTVTAKGKAPASNLTKRWFTYDGFGRGEMDLAGLMLSMMGKQANSKPIIMLSHANMPAYSVTLDDEAKTYSLDIIDTALINSNQTSYKPTLVGDETIGSYHCKHVKLTAKKQEIDLWTSTDVPGYTIYKKLAGAQRASSANGMLGALKQVNADGFVVKMTISNKDVTEVMLLTKAQLQPLQYSFFGIPPGYTESKENGIISNLINAGQSVKK